MSRYEGEGDSDADSVNSYVPTPVQMHAEQCAREAGYAERRYPGYESDQAYLDSFPPPPAPVVPTIQRGRGKGRKQKEEREEEVDDAPTNRIALAPHASAYHGDYTRETYAANVLGDYAALQKKHKADARRATAEEKKYYARLAASGPRPLADVTQPRPASSVAARGGRGQGAAAGARSGAGELAVGRDESHVASRSRKCSLGY